MSDVILAALISAFSAITTAAMAAYIQLKIAEINAATERERIINEKGEENKKGGRNKKKDNLPVGLPTRGKSKINWPLTGLGATIVGLVIFFIIMGMRAQASTPEVDTPAISLSEAKIEFRITIKDHQVIIPAGGTLDVLHQGDQISIETVVTGTKDIPYPNGLTFIYYFASGGNFIGKYAPYLAKESDTITVKIEDEVTGEAITRSVFIEIK